MTAINARPTGGLLWPRPFGEASAATLPVGGATGQSLTKNSATDFDAGWSTPAGGGSSIGGGALVLLQEQVLSGAASAPFTSLISSAYDDYIIVMSGVVSGTNNQLFGVQLSTTNGASWITSGYEYGQALWGSSTNFSAYGRGTAQALGVISALSSTLPTAGKIELFGANRSEKKAFVFTGVIGNGGDGNVYGSVCGSTYPTASTFNAIRLITASGTLTGTFRLYGVAKTVSSGGGLYQKWDADKPPASANALDAEFATNNLLSAWPAGWTAQTTDFQNTLFPSSEPGRFSFWHNVAGHIGRYATAPAGGTDFNLAIRLAVQGFPSQFALCGIGLGSATNSGSGSWAGIYCGHHNSISTTLPGIAIENPSGTFATNYGASPAVSTGIVLYFRRVGTNYWAGWSIDGQRGPETGPFTLAFVPSYMHVFGYNSMGVQTQTEIFWVRHISGAGARQSWGGLRTIAGT